MGAYAVGALAVSAWTMRELGVAFIAASILVGALVIVGLSSYVSALALRPRDACCEAA